jgi:hypothetical protein
MQASPNATSWVEYAVIALATFIAGITGSFFTWLRYRNHTKPEIDSIHATAEKTRAEARRLDAETIAQGYDRIDELWAIAEGQRTHIRELGIESDKRGIAVEMLEYEVTWLYSVLRAAGVKLSDYDHLRKKRSDLPPKFELPP